MSMNTGVSGLNAASKQLGSIGNNIANSNTVGYKSTGLQFADLYSAESGSGGVYVAASTTNFSQGNLTYTSSATDLAVQGKGYFVISDAAGQQFYTRAGNFNVDKDGNLVNSQSMAVMGFEADKNGAPIEGRVTPVTIDTADMPAATTASITLAANLDATSATLAPANFDPSKPDTYTSTSTTVVYDSLGNEEQLTAYYSKSNDTPFEWNVRYQMKGMDVDSTGNLVAYPATTPYEAVLSFDSTGNLTSSSDNAGAHTPPGVITLPNINSGSGAEPLKLSVDVTKFTQYGYDFSVKGNKQDGSPAGSYNGVSISKGGAVIATYSNGRTAVQGYVSLATFPDPSALEAAGNTSWLAPEDAGAPSFGVPGKGTSGNLASKALEASNTDISNELVNLVVAQTAYSANAKSISTETENMRTLIQTV